jgi:quinol monooxygenase YgiN
VSFAQIIEVTAMEEQALGDHVAGWQAEQHGLVPGCRRARMLADEDMPGRYLIEGDFSSGEEAGRNNLRPETAAWAIKLAELTSGDPKFRNLRVVCTTGGG